MTPADFAAKMGRVAAALPRKLMTAERQTRDETLEAADRQSAGPYSQAELTKAGHPYARRAPQSGYDPAVINRGKGVFRASWKASGPTSGAGGVVTRIWNTDPNAKYLLGTKAMIERPVRQAILKAVQPGRVKRLKKAFRDAWRTK